MDFDEIIQLVFDEDNIIFVVGGILGLAGIIFGTVTGFMKTNAREKTRREIAAYIAEGSMTPEQGEKLLKAGKENA
ncbi:MAG: hypothetical protein AAFR76_02985 [Planctomycetota bacterium]